MNKSTDATTGTDTMNKLGTPVGQVKIQMSENGRWWDLGGVYSQSEADEAIGKFMFACRHKAGTSRAFRTRSI